MRKWIAILLHVVIIALPGYASAGRVANAAAASVVNMTTAIASYQVLRTMGAQPQIERTPYGMVTTTTNAANSRQSYSQSPHYNRQNQQDQKIQFMQQ